MKATVDYRKDAKPGDKVWSYDSQRSQRDEAGNYQGRGLWQLATVEKVGRKYLTTDEGTFFIDHGHGKSGIWQDWCGGEIELQDHRWREARYQIAREVEAARPEQLRQIGRVLGFDLPKLWIAK